MGTARWDPGAWSGYSSTVKAKPTAAIFTKSSIDPELDPRNVALRESCDSAENPESTPIMVGLDVTGSMGMLADVMVKEGLGTLAQEIIDRKPIKDPHILLAGLGDATMGDRAPLQVTQFEADIKIADQLEKVYLEHGGGGNRFESYDLLWYFAATRTKCDSMLKRGKKGYLFTVGDEEFPTPGLDADDLERVFGVSPQGSVSGAQSLEMAQQNWEVFHIMVAEGSHARSHEREVRESWTKHLGQRAVWLTDHKKLAEVIVSIVQANEGVDHDKVVSSWSGKTSLVVKDAIKDLVPAGTATHGVVRL